MPEDSQTPSSAPVPPTPPTPFMPPAPEVPAPSPTPSPAPGMPTGPMVSSMPFQASGFAQPVVSTHSVVTGSRPRMMKKPMMVAGIAVVAALLIGGGFVFGFYLPNTPENVYSAGIENTGKAFDALVSYSKSQQNADYKSADFDGTMKVASPSASFDFNLNGSTDTNGNATAGINLDVMSNKATANFRSIHAAGNTNPDMYFQLSGIKNYLDSNGLNSLDNLDGQWILVDHTLIDSYTSQLKDVTPGGVNPATVPSYAQIQDAETKVQTVNRQYLFSTNASTAVPANEKYLGQTHESGRTLNHYKVGYNKDHLNTYIQSVANALDASQLNDWSKKANGGKSLSDAMQFSQLESDIKSSKGDYTFDLWVDTGTRLVSKVTFTDTNPADNGGTFTVGQGYTGGDEYPFTLSASTKDASGNPQQFTVGTTVNTKTNKVSMTVDGATQDATGKTTISFSLNATPSKQTISVTAPAGAKSVTQILNELGLGGLASPNSANTPLIFQQ